MHHKCFMRILWIGMVTATLVLPVGMSAANPMERIDYWQKNYDELRPQDDVRAKRAHAIFNRVLQAAGTRPGVVPRLFIAREEPFGITLPIAIPDGGIILSQRVLDMCYRDPEQGDHLLAFVLGHEIAHLLKDDFWHMKFFQAMKLSKANSSQPIKELETILHNIKSTDQVAAKELQADEHGIIYAAMAGFDTRAVVTQDANNSFFVDWMRALAPTRLGTMRPDPSYPSPTQRAIVVKARLSVVLDKTEVFNLGLRFYQAGQYAKAILAFRDFLQFFPSREVYHNLAASHHQLALQYKRLEQNDNDAVPFKLSLAVDPITRASHILLRGSNRQGQDPDALYRSHLDKAIAYYQTALSLDPSYTLAYNNLGCALLLKGDVYKAIGTFQDALKRRPEAAEILNNLGVAFFLAENPRKAQTYLHQAHQQAPSYDAPLLNLGKIAYDTGQTAKARGYWDAYLQTTAASPWADVIRRHLSTVTPSEPERQPPSSSPAERLMGIQVGHFEDEIPESWGEPQQFQFSLEQEPFKISLYSHRVFILSQEGEILLIGTLNRFPGISSKGISVGSPVSDLLAHYGPPAKILHMTRGDSWLYDTQGIAFQLRDRKVVSWLLF